MKKFLLLFMMFFSALSHGAFTFNASISGNCTNVYVANLTCNSVKLAVDTCAKAALAAYESTLSCTADPVVNGTKLSYRYGGTVYSDVIVSNILTVCPSGTHLDSSTKTCVDDITTAIASCLPSIRTIAPCPSGFAPTNAIPIGSGAAAPFVSDFDGLPIQDMIYAVGMAVCGLLGIVCGVRLV